MKSLKLSAYGSMVCTLVLMLALFSNPANSILSTVYSALFYLFFGGIVVFSLLVARKPDYNPLFKGPHMQLSTANFHYSIETYGTTLKYITIIDFGGPYKSVTNDIENIIEDIIRWEKIEDMSQYLIIYKDSDDMWNAWDWATKDFVDLEADSALDAAKRYHTYSIEGSNELYERAE